MFTSPRRQAAIGVQFVRACVKIAIVRLNTFKEGCQVVISIAEVIQLDDLLKPYQLDRFASRCSRKSLNLLKDSLRDCGCSCQ